MNLKNTPEIQTDRLILRKFDEHDLNNIFHIFSDEEVNTFLPWFPLKSLKDAEKFYGIQYAEEYRKPYGYKYAVCLKDDNLPIGYVSIKTDDSYDLGYGLLRKFWHIGITTEACSAVIEQVKKDGLPFITATHDVKNPRSGDVMKRLGMKYMYSYEELWKPKNITVTFRMYQLNLDGNNKRIYREYWENAAVHFIETGILENE